MNLSPSLILSSLILIGVLNTASVRESNSSPFEGTAASVYKEIGDRNLSRNAFLLGYQGYCYLRNNNILQRDSLLTIIDYSKPSHIERLFIIDLKNKKVIKKSLVAHGKGSGVHFATRFSNTCFSNTSCQGFFVSANTYHGKHGYSLRIRGMETGINNNAYKRAIVVHGADYVCCDFIKKHGRLGRSFGCPALPNSDTKVIINAIKNGSCMFIYSPNEKYLKQSTLINSSYYYQRVSS